MIADNLITIVKTEYYILELNQEINRAYFTLSGVWKDLNDVSEYINDIKKCIEKLSPGFTLLVDLTRYNGTSAELQHIHFEAQRYTVEHGLGRLAEVFTSNSIFKFFADQYSKETGAVKMTFDQKLHAERWLDLY